MRRPGIGGESFCYGGNDGRSPGNDRNAEQDYNEAAHSLAAVSAPGLDHIDDRGDYEDDNQADDGRPLDVAENI